MNVRRGQIYAAAEMPGCIGSEQMGERPVLIISNNTGNRHAPVVTVAPLTSRISKKGLPVHVHLQRYENNLPFDSIALLEQISTIDKSRLKGELLTTLDDSKMKAVDAAILICLGLTAAKSQNGELYASH
jgi:mRNA interferase MazF